MRMDVENAIMIFFFPKIEFLRWNVLKFLIKLINRHINQDIRLIEFHILSFHIGFLRIVIFTN